MASVLVLYATQHGQTERIAARVAETIRSLGHAVDLVDAAELPAGFDVRTYDIACVGAPIHARGYPTEVLRFVVKHRAWLDTVPSAFFSVGLAVASRTSDGVAATQACVEAFTRRTGWHPKRVELIAGALPYTQYNIVLRWIMRRIAAQAGGDVDTSRDYEYTDWSAVERFAAELVPKDARPRAASTGVGAEVGCGR